MWRRTEIRLTTTPPAICTNANSPKLDKLPRRTEVLQLRRFPLMANTDASCGSLTVDRLIERRLEPVATPNTYEVGDARISAKNRHKCFGGIG